MFAPAPVNPAIAAVAAGCREDLNGRLAQDARGMVYPYLILVEGWFPKK